MVEKIAWKCKEKIKMEDVMGKIMQLETMSQSIKPLAGGDAFLNTCISGSSLERMSLEEAMREGLVEVEQLDHFNHIPQMRVANHSARKILLFSGREVIGRNRNRFLTINMILRHNASVVIPAFFLASTYFFDQGMISIQKYLHHFTAMDNQAGVVYRINGRLTGERFGDFPLRVEVCYNTSKQEPHRDISH